MPFVRKGNTVYKRIGKKLVKKGSSSSARKAKGYMRALYTHSKGR